MPESETQAPEKKLAVSLDSASSTNASGTAFRAGATLQYTPIPVSLSAGSGFINLNYLNGPLGFGSGKIDFRTNIGQNWQFFAVGTFTAFPKTENMQAQYFEAANIGATWTIVPERHGFMVRAGIQDSAKLVEVPTGTVVDQLYDSLDGGVSFGYRRLTAYAMGRLAIAPYNPTQQYWSELIRPFPESLRVGAVLDAGRGDSISAELNVSDFEQGGRLTYRIARIPVPTQIGLSYRHTSRTFGGTSEFGTVVAMKLDGNRVKARLRADFEAGGASLEKPTSYDVHPVSSQAVAQYMYGQGRLSPTQLVQRQYPNATITGTSTAEIGGKQVLTVNYTINGVSHSVNVPSREAALQAARSELGQQTFDILEGILSSNSLQQFADRYAGRSIDDKVYAAATLALIARSGYNFVLENASPFASQKKNLALLDPETEFANLQRSLTENKKQNMGICVNIDGLAADFLRRSGVEAYTLIVGSGNGLHAIAGALDPQGTTGYAISYGQVYKARSGGLWPAVQAYSRESGIILVGSLVYGAGNRLVGYYRGPEGRLMDTVQDSGVDSFIDELTRRQ